MAASTTTGAPTAERVLAAVADRPGAPAADLAGATGLGRSTVTKTLATLEQTGQVTRTHGGRDNGRRQSDQWSPPADADRRTAAENGGKLGTGQLRSLVLDYLQNRPGQEHSPTAIGKALGRSSGAVGNALTKLAAGGTVTETSAKPRRYTAQP